MDFSNTRPHAKAQLMRLPGGRPPRGLLTDTALFGQRVCPVVHQETTVAFDLDQPRAPCPLPKLLEARANDVEVLDVFRVGPKVDSTPSKQ